MTYCYVLFFSFFFFFWLEPKEAKVQDWIFLLKNQSFLKKIPITRAEMKIILRC